MEKYINRNSVYLKKESQEQRLYAYLKEHGKITNLQAIMELGIMQCPARIWGLIHRHQIPIKKSPKTVINRFGEEVRVIEYSLGEMK